MVALLPDHTHPALPIHALHPSRRHLSRKVRVFIEMLQERFGAIPYWEGG
jgi:DNA-binding transcriptional LysR family regulator